MQFDLTDLRLLVAVAETNSLSRGAERCHLSVPAVSVRIKHLEERVGSRLLHRTHQGVTLTPAGQTFVQHARLVMGQLQHLHHDMQAYGRGLKGHLRVFASITAIAEFLPRVLGRYLATHRDVDVDLREHASPYVVRAVSSGQADLGIVSGPVRTEGLEVMRYRDDELVLVVPQGHVLAAEPRVTFETVLQYDQVGLQEGTGMHIFLAERALAHGQPLKLRIQVGSFEASSRMVEADAGISIMPRSAALRHRHAMRIELLTLDEPWAHRQLHLCARSFDLLPGFARELVELLKADADDGNTAG